MNTRKYFLGVKAAGALGWQPYHLHEALVLKCWSLKLLEPSGPVQACNGIALPSYLFTIQWRYCCKHSITITYCWESYWPWLLKTACRNWRMLNWHTGEWNGKINMFFISAYTVCPGRNVPDFRRIFLKLKYTDITQNTHIQSWTVTEIMAREVWKYGSCYTLIDY